MTEQPSATPASATGERSRPTSRARRIAGRIGMAILFLVIVLVLLLTVGAFVPGLGLVSTAGTILIATVSPHFVLIGLVVVALGYLAVRRGRRRSGWTAVGMGATAAVANVVAVAILVGAAAQGGGSVNLATATFGLSSISSATPDRTEVYAETETGEPLTLDIYEPTGTAEPRATIFFVHGGAFIGGSAAATSADQRALADAGYLVVSANYEVATADKPMWDKTPAQVACAATWLASHADDLDADLDRLVYWGDSAGGNLALNAAYSAAQGTAVSSCGGEVPVPRAVMADFPAVDMESVVDDGFTVGSLRIGESLEWYTGGTTAEYPERYAATSTATYLSADAPPTLIIEPTRDEVVPTQGVLDFAATAKDAGIDVEVVTIPLSWHIYNQIASNSIGSQAHLTIMLSYLASQGL